MRLMRTTTQAGNRRCSKCCQWKPLRDFYWTRSPRYSAGGRYYSWCKTCWGRMNRLNIKQWRSAHAEYVKHKNATYRMGHHAYFVQWYEENKWRYRIYSNKRRALKSGNGGRYDYMDILRLYQSQHGHCFYCGQPLREVFEVDHKIPLSRGGSNGTENLCVACRHCNRTKHARTASEFMVT